MTKSELNERIGDMVLREVRIDIDEVINWLCSDNFRNAATVDIDEVVSRLRGIVKS